MDHKEKCKVLKEVRKNIADKLGIDLHQTECTYEGECSGTCPKCAKEEKTLNKALLSGAVMASAIALCACGVDSNVDGGSRADRDKDRDSKKSEKKGSSGSTKNNKDGNGLFAKLFGSDDNDDGDEGEWLGGLEEMPPEDDPDYLVVGEEIAPDDGDDIEELAGDVAMVAWSYDELCGAAANYTGAPVCEVDSEDEYGNIIIHCYEFVDEDDIEVSTIAWITVDPYTGDATNDNGDSFNLLDYME